MGHSCMFFDWSLSLLSTLIPLPPPIWSLSVRSLFPCFWFYFAHLFVYEAQIPSYKTHSAAQYTRHTAGHDGYLQLLPTQIHVPLLPMLRALGDWAMACRGGIPGHNWPTGGSGRRLEQLECLLISPFSSLWSDCQAGFVPKRKPQLSTVLLTQLSPQVPSR